MIYESDWKRDRLFFIPHFAAKKAPQVHNALATKAIGTASSPAKARQGLKPLANSESPLKWTE